MEKDRDHGVVHSFGKYTKVMGALLTNSYPDLYVVDGAIAPTSLGVNSSLTISALAFRIAENIVVNPANLPIEPVLTGSGKSTFQNSFFVMNYVLMANHSINQSINHSY